MELFFKDSLTGIEVTWTRLLSDLNGTESYNPYCYSENIYTIFKQIICSLILGEEIILLDSDFTSDELVRLTGFYDFNNFRKPTSISGKHPLSAKGDLLARIRSPKKSWKITLFTSGTTGLPKKVTHSFESITRFVKVSEKNALNIWGLAYHPAHMAGIQVFFQALLNGNSLIRLFGLPKEQIYREIELGRVTNISATPTFYRLLLPYGGSCSSVNRITSGGEKFDERTINQVRTIFPNAKITNVYASTEAGTLFASDGTTFAIKAGLEHLIKIDNGELLVHQSLLGNPGITKDEWYFTGDLVEVAAENPVSFRFISRKNEMINVGGYKVNPNEVEDAIRSIPGIQDAWVYSKSSSVLGNVICCEVVKTDARLDETNIRSWLQSKLQEFKIPRMITFVEALTTTPTGKLNRAEQ